MNAQGLAELGSWIAGNGVAFIFGEKQTADVANEYWSAAKCRGNRWATTLRMFARDLEGDSSDPEFHDPWGAMHIVIQEIFLSEMLTRIWSAMLVAYDSKAGVNEMAGLAHSVHISHMEAKNRALRLMLKGRAVNEQAFDKLNKLRHRIERWTDLYLSLLPDCPASRCFAFDQARVADFRKENEEYTASDLQIRQQLLAASLVADLADVAEPFPANPELNSKIASGILACFASDRFDLFGLPKVAQQVLLERAQYETNTLLEKLIHLENTSDEVSISKQSACEWN